MQSSMIHVRRNIRPGTLCAAMVVVAGLAAPSAALADLTFLTQERWIETVAPRADSLPTRVSSPGFTRFNEVYTNAAKDSEAIGKGDATQDSTLGSKITATGTASGIGGGPIGFGSGESYFKTTFTADTDTTFNFLFNASSFESSVVQYFNFSFTGEGVNFTSGDSFRLVFGQTFDLSGEGTLKAGQTYTVEIDLYAFGDGMGTNGDGSFGFSMVTIPAPGASLAMGLGLAGLARRRR